MVETLPYGIDVLDLGSSIGLSNKEKIMAYSMNQSGTYYRIEYVSYLESKILIERYVEIDLSGLEVIHEPTGSISFKQHQQGWIEVRTWDGGFVLGIFVPATMETDMVALKKEYCGKY